MKETVYRLNELLDKLIELSNCKDRTIKGQEYAIEVLKGNQKKVIRELKYLKSQYDSKVEREAIDNAINVVSKVYE